MDRFNVGKRIKELREQAGLEAKDVAQKLNFTPSFMSLLENDKRPCSIPNLEDICGVLGISLQQFFCNGQCSESEDIAELVADVQLNKELGEILRLVRDMTKEKMRLVLNLCGDLKRI
jgi:transcriptional regulator with XRE-family HTH domain